MYLLPDIALLQPNERHIYIYLFCLHSAFLFSKVNVRGQDVELVRVRNPWGNEREWEGAWGDK